MGGNRVSINKSKRCWTSADRQDSLARRSGPWGPAGEMTWARNVDVIVWITVFHIDSRLVAQHHILTACLQRWGVRPGGFKYLGTTKGVSVALAA